jgi:glucose-6-phosphate dehydrogenase assembly protein OpcA
MQTSDRLVVDTDKMHDELGAMLVLAHLADLEPSCTIGDLNWDRFEMWRDLLEQQRNITDMRHHLASVESVEIRYAGSKEEHKPSRAILFLTWLAKRLGWDTNSVSSHSGERFTFRVDEGRTVAAYVHPIAVPMIEAGALVSIKIVCRSEGKAALLSVSRTADPHHITVRTEHNDDVAEEGYRLEPPTTAALLMMELDAGPRDREYGNILRAAGPLVRAARA